MKVFKKIMTAALSLSLVVPQCISVSATGPFSTPKGVVWDDDGFTQTNIDAFSEYAEYFYFKKDKVNVKAGEQVKVSYFLDSAGFDDLGEFTLFIDNKEVATIEDGANTSYCYVNGIAKGSTLLQAAYEGSLVASMCINVVSGPAESSGSDNDGSGSNPGAGSDSSGVNISDNENSNGSSGDPADTSAGIGVNVSGSDSFDDSSAGGSANTGVSVSSPPVPEVSAKPEVNIGDTEDTDINSSNETILDTDNGSYGSNVFQFASSSASLKVKGTKSVKYSLALYNDSDITFSSSNEKVATVKKLSNQTIKVTAVGSGKATITAKHKSLKDAMTSKIAVTVTDPKKNAKKTTTAIKLNKKTASLAKAGSKVTLKATVKGTDVVLPSGAKISWSSSNTKAAVVSPSGVVTAKKKGTATITAKCTGKINGKSRTSKATCKVTVKK